ncbi:hypothetical protein [Streptomyces sp. NPDC052015]|uniref:hypothetical protein n=1 Tax=Streptomyces sp. NPDC052015 TaxID=3154755 RepID=UPI003418DB77
MALDIRTILAAVESHALSSGYFVAVNGHEPKSPPPTGITAAVWVEQIGPARGASGLDSTTARLALYVRLYSSLVQQPADAIDPDLMTALDALMAAYSGDFTLGGLVRNVDLRGQHGDPLSARAGYLAEGGAEYRVLTITLPLIVNDLWTEAP